MAKFMVEGVNRQLQDVTGGSRNHLHLSDFSSLNTVLFNAGAREGVHLVILTLLGSSLVQEMC